MLNVTFTGLDKNTSEQDLEAIKNASIDAGISMEFATLYSIKREAKDIRYPGASKRMELLNQSKKLGVPIAIHICGTQTIERLAHQDPDLLAEIGLYDRVQVNFFAGKEEQMALFDEVVSVLKHINIQRPVIFPYNKKNKELFLSDLIPHDFEILVDFSGGTGKSLSSEHLEDLNLLRKFKSIGIAGGLSPDNIDKKMMVIQNVVRDNPNIAWIDGESGFRENNLFSQVKCVGFLNKM